MSIEIEKGVPMPRPRARRTKYPFDDMEVGDSFWAENGESAKVAAVYRTGKTGEKFVTQREGAGRRVWRVE